MHNRIENTNLIWSPGCHCCIVLFINHFSIVFSHYVLGLGVVGRRLGPFAIVGVVRPDMVGVCRPVGVALPDRLGVDVFGVRDEEGLGGVGVVDRPSGVPGVGVFDRPNGCRGLM